MKFTFTTPAAILGLLFASIAPASALDDVVASIGPVHSLVSAVMKGAGEPHLIVRGASSPHTHRLRPSDARALQDAELVFWIGPQLEPFLQGAIETLAANAKAFALSKADGIELLKVRDPDGDGDGDSHDHGLVDMHIWLNLDNAKAMVVAIVKAMSDNDPANASLFRNNAKQTLKRIDVLAETLRKKIQPVADRPFIVFHDAFQYFEKFFGLNAIAAISASPNRSSGAKHLQNIRSKLKTSGPVCIFSEPQFDAKLVTALASDTEARSAVLDPLGADIPNGSDHYFTLMERLGASISECLKPSR